MATLVEDLNLSSGFVLTPRVPYGLAAAVESLTREVLRQRPENIYEFAARHFEKLLRLREEYKYHKRQQFRTGNYKMSCDLSEILKRRDNAKKNVSGSELHHNGWSLNETAKVLERYRSIFGDAGSKISTNEIRALSEKEEINLNKLIHESQTKENIEMKSKSKHRISYNIHTNREKSVKRDIRSSKFISEMPILSGNKSMQVKDIKSELRKNRNNSKEKINIRENLDDKSVSKKLEDKYEEINDMDFKKTSVRKSLEKTKTNEFDEDCKKEKYEDYQITAIEQNDQRDIGNKFFDSSSRKISKRANSMEKVIKEYTSHKFTITTSLEELQSPIYVEKVQKIVDQTSPILTNKVELLKKDLKIFENLQIQQQDEERDKSVFDQTFEDTCEKEDKLNNSLKDADNVTSDSASIKVSTDTLEARLSATQNLLKDISNLTRSKPHTIRSKSAKDLRRINGSTANLISEMSIEFERKHRVRKISLPEVRLPLSKNLKSPPKTYSDPLILPPIASEVSKIAKKKNDLVLPILSPPKNISSSIELQTTTNAEARNELFDEGNEKDSAENSNKLNTNKEKHVKNIEDSEYEQFSKDTLIKQEYEPYNEKSELSAFKLFENDIKFRDKNLENKVKEVQINDFSEKINISNVIDDKAHINSSNTRLNASDNTIGLDFLNDNKDEVIQFNQDNIIIENDLQKTEKGESNTEKFANSDIIERIDQTNLEENTFKTIDKCHMENVEELKKETLIIDEDNQIIKHNNNENDKINNENDTIEKNEELNPKTNFECTKSENLNSTQQLTIDKNIQINNNKSEIMFTNEENTIPYVLTEGSPYEVPSSNKVANYNSESHTHDSDNLDDKIKIHLNTNIQTDTSDYECKLKTDLEAFGEYIQPSKIERLADDIDFIRNIKLGHDKFITKQDLDQITEEDDKELEGSEDKENKTNLISGLDNIEENEENEDKKDVNVIETDIDQETFNNNFNDSNEFSSRTPPQIIDLETTDEVKETSVTDNVIEVIELAESSLEVEECTEMMSSESTNEVKETTITDRSLISSSIEAGQPIVPELNLDSLQDITVSSFKMSDDDMDKRISEETIIPESLSSNEIKPDQNINQEINIEKDIARKLIEIVQSDELEKKDGEDILTKNIISEHNKTIKNEELLIPHIDLEEKNSLNTLINSTEPNSTIEILEGSFETEVDNNHLSNISKTASNSTSTKLNTTNLLEIETTTNNTNDFSVIKDFNDKEHNYSTDKEVKNIVVEKNCENKGEIEEVKKQITCSQENNDKINISNIHISDVDQSLDESNTESSTFNSAATTIQAGIRGFLTRRYLQNIQHYTSTLNSVPSIQEDLMCEDQRKEQQIQEELNIDNTFNFKTRQHRLRRENAIQNLTSLNETVFSQNNLQHTSEFHDCLPLSLFINNNPFSKLYNLNQDEHSQEHPVLEDISIQSSGNDNFFSVLIKQNEDNLKLKIDKEEGNLEKRQLIKQEEKFTEVPINSDSKIDDSYKIKTAEDGNKMDKEIEEAFIQQSNIPIVHISTNVNQLVSLLMIASSESKSNNKDLNFVTSIEDIEQPVNNEKTNKSSDNINVKEPLALPGSPKGVIIEEITSLEVVKTTESSYESSNKSVPSVIKEENEIEQTVSTIITKNEDEDNIKEENNDTKLSNNSLNSTDDERDFLENSPISFCDPTSPE